MKKLMAMILITIMMVSMMGISSAAETLSPDGFVKSVFKFNHQYTVTGIKDKNLGNEATILSSGTIFTIGDGLFATALCNISKIPGKKYLDEKYFTTINSKKHYYTLVYTDKERKIVIFKADKYLVKHSNALVIAEHYNAANDVYTVGFQAEEPTILQNAGYLDGNRLVTFKTNLDAGQYGSPILSTDGVVGIIVAKSFVNNKIKEAYAINLQDLKDSIKDYISEK